MLLTEFHWFDFCSVTKKTKLDTSRPSMKFFVDFHQRSWLQQTAKNIKRGIGDLVGDFDSTGLCGKELFVVRKLDFDANVHIADWWIYN